MPRSGRTESYDSSIFSFIRNFHIDFHSGCTNLYAHQQGIRVPFSCILASFVWFLDNCHSDWDEMESQYNCDLHLLFEDCLFNSSTHLLIWLFFWCLIFGAFYILQILSLYLEHR
jgi:hypothetical protein